MQTCAATMIKEYRRFTGCNLEEFGKRQGVNAGSIYKYEKGDVVPNANFLIRMIFTMPKKYRKQIFIKGE